MKKYDFQKKPLDTYSIVSKNDQTGDFSHKEGIYKSDLGIVEIWANTLFVMFEFIYNGISYYRTLQKLDSEIDNIPSDRSLIIRAGKFQREIHKKYGKEK